MKMPHCRKTFAAMIAIAGLVLCPAAYADDEGEWGDDPGDEWGTPEYCDKHGHSWEFDVTDPPSCESAGFDLYYCSCCGEYDQRNFVAPTGHNYNQNGICVNCNQPREGVIVYTHHPAVAPTCVWRGNIEYWSGSDGQFYDSEGGNTLAEDQVWIPALDHAWTAWTTNAIPTCTTMGRVTRSCTRADCNATETQSISALGHAWTAWTTNTPPTCMTAGSETHSCTRCSETETQEIPALGHDYSAWTTNVLPTCTSPGSEGSLCTRCGTGETQAIPALGHDWTAWTVVTPATYTALGEEERDCSRCDAHETRALAVLQHSSFSVGGSGNTFTVVRTGEGTNLAETVYYRAVSLSAYAGQNFTSKSGSLTFAPGQIFTNVVVSTRTPSSDAYKFQSGTTRAYRFELLDEGGFRLDGKDRTITAGTSVSTNGAFNIKNVTIQAAEYTADDDGYDKNGYKSVSSNAYFSAAAPKAYFQHVGAQLRMTLSMQAKENDDGYQYLQFLVNETVNCDNRKSCSDGDPGNISLSRYMAGFEIKSGSKDDSYKTYTFPVTNASNNAGAVDPWGYGNKYPLDKQKFKDGCRASDGRIIIPLDFTNLVLRLNASGSSGSDEWAAKNVKAHVQAVDSAVPTLLGATVSPGPYHSGNTVTVSLAFSEIVVTKPSSGFFLRTSWGLLGYEGGTCGNVLTFSGKIDDGTTDSTPLSVTGFSGLTSIKDLAGNAFGGSVSRSLDASVAPSVDYAIAYDLAGGALPPNEDPNPDVYNYDSDIITLTNPVRPGYTFAGWSGTGFSGTRTTVTIYHSHGDRAYTAHWTPIEYAVHFEANGGTGTMTNQTFTYNAPQALSANAFACTGYAFAGWTVSPDGSGTGYADGETVGNLTNENGAVVNLYAQWNTIPWAGTGTRADPYVIMYPSQLDLLAAQVNAGDKFENTYFVLGTNITYAYTTDWNDATSTENNYTAIGRRLAEGTRNFEGTFDGQGYTVSGIRIYKGGDSTADGWQGLFGRTYDGTVKNVTLADARITGRYYVGGIVGDQNYGIVENCHVASNVAIHAVADSAKYHGGIVGYLYGSRLSGKTTGCTSAATLTMADGLDGCMYYGGIVGQNYRGEVRNCFVLGATVPDVGDAGAVVGYNYDNAPLASNYYRACTVAGTANATGVGTGAGDVAGALPVFTVGGNDIAVASTPDVTHDGTDYYAEGSVVTLAYVGTVPAGFTLSYVVSAGTIDGDSLTMPAADVTVTATLAPPSSWIPYVDANGDTQYCTEYTVLTNAAGNVAYGVSGAEAWYVVTNDVTISGSLYFAGSAHLILCDGATLTVTNASGIAIKANGNFTIYCQVNGTGAVVANCEGSGIYVSIGGITINGGSVTVNGGGNGITSSGGVTINGGNVAATVANHGGTGIYGAFITLYLTNPSDSIYASSYSCLNNSVSVMGDLTDGFSCIYAGHKTPSFLAGKTLRPLVTTPTYPAYLDEADNNVIANYDYWAEQYGYDALGVNETAFLLDVAPGAVTNGVTPLRVVEVGSTNVLVAGSVYENLMWEYMIDYDEDYLPCRRIVLESGVGALKPGPWREYSGTPSSFDICNGYVVLRFTHDLSLPKSEWWAISWFVDFEGDRAVVLVPTMFKEHIRMVVEQQLNRPVSGLFLSVGIEPCTVIDPDTILTFFPMPPLVE